MANGTLKVSNIETSSGSGTITLGASGETISVPSGATLDMSSGTMTLNSSMKNSPSFQAIKSGNQSIPDNTYTKLQPDTENWDTDNAYDNSSNYRFTPQTSGKYVLHGFCQNNSSTNITYIQLAIFKNGSVVEASTLDSGDADYDTAQITRVVEANGSSDYFELYLLQYSGGALNFKNLNFTGYKLIGV